MSDTVIFTQCDKCKVRLNEEWLSFHNCEEDEKITAIERQIQGELDKSLKLKLKNLELKKSIDSIKKEITSSFDQMRSIVEGYSKKPEKKEEKKEDNKEVKEVKETENHEEEAKVEEI